MRRQREIRGYGLRMYLCYECKTSRCLLNDSSCILLCVRDYMEEDNRGIHYLLPFDLKKNPT